MRRRTSTRQRGAALLVLLAILALGASWFLVSRLDALSASYSARDRQANAVVLNRAKQALIGYVAAQAGKGSPLAEDNPGALPCPEHPWYINRVSPDDGQEGRAGPAIGISSPGSGTANCSSIGRYPWRTIGTEVLVDAAGEPLWFVVGPTWRPSETVGRSLSQLVGLVRHAIDAGIWALIVLGPIALLVAGATFRAGWATEEVCMDHCEW